MNFRTLSKILILITFFLAACRHHDISIEQKDSDDELRLTMSYPQEKTESVQDFLNEAFAPDELFQSAGDDIDTDLSLDDGTKFHLKASAGRLAITLDKHDNSEGSYKRMKAIMGRLTKRIS